ncbi:hypothetical protein BSKO_05092 [Bryopsis sp. KO-2023]|nr:hypothetical protein BSKO_05092 [Bryopsis sp. KO-2023]
MTKVDRARARRVKSRAGLDRVTNSPRRSRPSRPRTSTFARGEHFESSTTMSEDPKPIGVDVGLPELAENQQRPEGPRSDKAISSWVRKRKERQNRQKQKKRQPTAREPSSTKNPVDSEPAGEPIDEEETLKTQQNCPDAPDIDSMNKHNPLSCWFYASRIFDNYHRRQDMFVVPENYLEHQDKEVARGRMDIVNWMVETHTHMKFQMKTLFLSINYMDRYLAAEKIAKTELNVLAATCLFMAGKYEERMPPRTKDIIECMGINNPKEATKTQKAILVQERALYTTLEGFAALPTLYDFVWRYL